MSERISNELRRGGNAAIIPRPGFRDRAAVDLRNSLLPDTVTDPATGQMHKRPGKWR